MNGNMNMNYNQFNNNRMMNNNMNPNMMGNNMMQQQQQQQMQNPLDQEKVVKRKKLIKKLVIFLIIFSIMFGGKKYIDYITVDYKTVVNESLAKYYVSTDAQDLEPIANLLTKYQKNANIVKNIQNYSYEKVGQWFLYIDDKYVCDKENLNSCIIQLKEFKYLMAKLELLAKVKGGGYFILQSTIYEALKAEGESKIERLTTASKNKTYTSPENADAKYQKICADVNVDNDCKCNTSDGTCTCTYYVTDAKNNKTPEEITCYKPETIKQK